jgi:hypothetical protein
MVAKEYLILCRWNDLAVDRQAAECVGGYEAAPALLLVETAFLMCGDICESTTFQRHGRGCRGSPFRPIGICASIGFFTREKELAALRSRVSGLA